MASSLEVSVQGVGLEKSIVDQYNRGQKAIAAKPLQLKVAGGNGDFKTLNASAAQFNKTLESVTRRVSAFAAAGAVFLTVDKFFKNLVSSTIDVDEALTKINVNLGQTAEGLKKFGEQVFDIARETGTSFKDAAKAAEELARQGLSAEQTAQRLKEALLLARIAGIDTTEAVSGLTAAINSFSREALSGYEIINKLAAVDTRFAVSSKDLTEGISRAGAAAQDAGVSFDQLLAIITSVQQTTQRGGAVIGNALKTIFTRVSRPEVLEQIQQLGIAVKDTSGAFLPAIQVLQNVATQYDNLSKVQQNFLTEQIGSVFQINVLKSALRDLSKENGTYSQALRTSNSASNEAIQKNAELNKSLKSSLEATKNSFTEFFSSLGNEGVSPVLKSILDSVEAARKYLSGGSGDELGKFLGEGIIKGISNVLTGPALFGAVFVIGKTIRNVIDNVSAGVKGVLSLNSLTENRAATLGRINTLLNESTTAEQANIRAATTQLELKQAILAVNQRIVATEAAQSIVISSSLASELAPSLRPRRAAGGYLPAVTSEANAIRAGIGGASASAKPVTIGNFAYGGGVTGPIVANTDEYMVKNYAGGGSAIFNPAMIAARGLPPGATKVGTAAHGFIPNAAFGTTPGFDIGLRSASGASISKSDTEALTKLFEAVKKAGSGNEARDLGKGVIDFSVGLNKVSQSHVLDKLGQVFTSFDNGSRLAARAGVARANTTATSGDFESTRSPATLAEIDAQNDRMNLRLKRRQSIPSVGYSEPIGPQRPGIRSRLLSRLSGAVSGVSPLAVSLAAPFAAGFVPEGKGGTLKGAALGAGSLALQGAGIGAIFGPAGIGIGAAIGALAGAFNKASRSVEEFSKDVDDNSAKQKEGVDAFSRASNALDQLNDARKSGAAPDIIEKLTASFTQARGQIGNQRLANALDQSPENRTKTLVDEQAKLERQNQLGNAAKAFEATRGRGFSGDDLGSSEVTNAIKSLSVALTKEQVQTLRGSQGKLNTVAQGNFNFADEESVKTAQDLQDTIRGLGGAFSDTNVHVVDASKSAYILSRAVTIAGLNFRDAANTAAKAGASVGKIALSNDSFTTRNPQAESALAGISQRRVGRQNAFDIARTNLAGFNALGEISPESKKLFNDESSNDPRAVEYRRNLRTAQQGNLLDAAGAFIQRKNPEFRTRGESGNYNIQAITSSVDQLTKNANKSIAAAALDLKERLVQAANGISNVGGYGANGVTRNADGSGVPYENGVAVQTGPRANGGFNVNPFSRNVIQRGGGSLPSSTDTVLINGVLKASNQFKLATDALANAKLEATNTFNVNVVLDPQFALISNQQNVDALEVKFKGIIAPLILQLGELRTKTPAPPSAEFSARRQTANLNRQAERP